MKKSFFGYSIKDVNESFSRMLEQKQTLQDEIISCRQIIAELEERAASVTANTEELEQLRRDLEAIQAENAQLKQQVQELTQRSVLQVKQAQPAEQRDEIDMVSDICRRAYKDMNQLTKDTKNSLRDVSDKMMSQMQSYENQLAETMERLAASQKACKEYLVANMEEMLRIYSSIEENNNAAKEELVELNLLRGKVAADVRKMLDTEKAEKTTVVRPVLSVHSAQDSAYKAN